MKVPSNFTTGATRKNPLEEAINNNFSNASETSVISVNKEKKIKKTKENFLVSMSMGERSLFKAFCAMQGVSMNHFVICAMDYLKTDIENGKVKLSAHGCKRIEK